MNDLKYLFPILLLVFLIGCNERNELPKEQSVSQSYVEGKGYQIVSYEGRVESYELTKQKIVALPYMMYWGLDSLLTHPNILVRQLTLKSSL